MKVTRRRFWRKTPAMSPKAQARKRWKFENIFLPLMDKALDQHYAMMADQIFEVTPLMEWFHKRVGL